MVFARTNDFIKPMIYLFFIINKLVYFTLKGYIILILIHRQFYKITYTIFHFIT